MNDLYNNENNTQNQNFDNGPIVNTSIGNMIGDQISARTFNLIIGLCLLWGFAFNFVIVQTVDAYALAENYVLVVIGYFISCFIGILMYRKCDNPILSFIGYNLIVLPIGLILSVALYGVPSELITSAIFITGVTTLLMMTLGIVFPNVFKSIIATVSIALLVTIVIELLMTLFSATTPIFIDYVVALLFCGYIGYDWGKANAKEKTLDNAIDGAAELYLDIINLFLRILIILMKSNRRR